MKSESTRCGDRSTGNLSDAVNLSYAERSLSAVAGGLLLVHAIRRRPSSGLMSLAVGAGLLYRGLTGRCPLYSKLGISAGPREPEGDPESKSRPPAPAAMVTDVSLAATGELPAG